ncbi:MAG: hypothetical protein Q4D92_05520 [Slackia sp.]|nr:hypothetical protein [Slackia sp.]
MKGVPCDLDVMLVVRDLNDEETGFDEVLFGCALRKDDLKAFLTDLAKLVESYGGAEFAELLEHDEGDEALVSARRRWLEDASSDLIESARLVIEEGCRR